MNNRLDKIGRSFLGASIKTSVLKKAQKKADATTRGNVSMLTEIALEEYCKK